MARTTYARPNCTHVNMDVVHFSAICDVCGQEASLGWVYECQQDRVEQDITPSLPSSAPNDTSTVAKMKSMGFSESIVRQIKEGHYTEAQIEVLIQQKTKVKKVIEESEAFHPNVTVRRKKLVVPFKKTDSKAQMTLAAKCNLRCCHVSSHLTIIKSKAYSIQTCRPYYKDRVFASLIAVAENIDAAYDQTLFKDLKVVDAAIVRQLALRKSLEGCVRIASSAESLLTSITSSHSSYAVSSGDLEVLDTFEQSRRLAEMPVCSSTVSWIF
jgi:hypothetical protein